MPSFKVTAGERKPIRWGEWPSSPKYYRTGWDRWEIEPFLRRNKSWLKRFLVDLESGLVQSDIKIGKKLKWSDSRIEGFRVRVKPKANWRSPA